MSTLEIVKKTINRKVVMSLMFFKDNFVTIVTREAMLKKIAKEYCKENAWILPLVNNPADIELSSAKWVSPIQLDARSAILCTIS